MSATRTSRRALAPRKTPKQPRSHATVEAILEASAQAFERHGYAGGTTNRIAARAGVSIGSLYQYFPNKDAILVALVRSHIADGTAMLAPQVARLEAGEDPLRVIPDVVAAMVSLHAEAPRLHQVLFEETPLPRALRDELNAAEDALVEVLARSLGANDTIGTEARLKARVVVSAIEGLTHRLVPRAEVGVSAEAIRAEVTTLVENYLRRPAPARSRAMYS